MAIVTETSKNLQDDGFVLEMAFYLRGTGDTHERLHCRLGLPIYRSDGQAVPMRYVDLNVADVLNTGSAIALRNLISNLVDEAREKLDV